MIAALQSFFPAVSWKKFFPVKTRFIPRRIETDEFLDSADVPASLRDASYRDLDRIGRMPGMRGPVLAQILRLLSGRDRTRFNRKRPLRLLEVGCGTGHLGRWLAVQLARRGYTVDLILTDVRKGAIAPTPARIRHHPSIRETLRKLDVFKDEIPPHDVCVMHLVLHHFRDADIPGVLARLAPATHVGGVVSDLRRHPVPFHFIRLFFPWLISSPVTVADGMLSVQQAFSKSELRAHAGALRAPSRLVSVRAAFPFRLLLSWKVKSRF